VKDSLLRHTVILLLLAIGIAGFLLRVNEARKTSDLAHPDEVFQTLEPAHRLAFGYGIITWEWRDGIRSWVLPTLLAGVMKYASRMGRGSDGYLVAIRVLLSAISMVTVWFGFVWAKRAGGTVVAIISAAACATWYEIVGFAPRAMTEVIAGNILLVGLYLGVYAESMPETLSLFLAGLSCGIVISLRIQLAPVVAFAALYFCWGSLRKRLPIVVSGILLPVLAFGLVDAVTWHHAFQSFYLYVWENAIEGKSALYGTRPWYWYLVEQASHLGPVAVLALIGVRRSHFLGWAALVIIASHSVIAHKEARFLYPALPIIIVLSALGFWEIARELTTNPIVLIPVGIGFFALFSWLLTPKFEYWQRNDGAMTALIELSKKSGVCGVGLYGVPWFDSGGYAYLHRDVPIVVISSPERFGKDALAFNSVVARSDLPNSSFVLSDCWNGVCLYQRPGSCTRPNGDEVNNLLRETGN
jgi:GPI mannosyltransferase 3